MEHLSFIVCPGGLEVEMALILFIFLLLEFVMQNGTFMHYQTKQHVSYGVMI